MQAAGVILTLITIGTILGPIAGVVIIYRDDLTQLIIPPELNTLIGDRQQNGDGGHNNGGDNYYNGGSPTGNPNDQNIPGTPGDDYTALFNPRVLNVEVNSETHTFTVTVEFTNSMSSSVTLNSLDAQIAVTQDMYPAGSVSLTNPVTIPSGQTAQATLTGTWSQEAKAYIKTNYPDATQVDLFVTSMTVNANGMTVQSSDVHQIGTIPVNGGD